MRIQSLSSNWSFKDDQTRLKVVQVLKKYQPNTIGNLLKSPIDSGLRQIYQNGVIVRIE